MSIRRPRVVFVHDWLNGMRGGEHVLEAMAELYPEAPIYTLIAEYEKLSKGLREHSIFTSGMQTIPGAVKHYRYFLPWMPKWIESLKLPDCDLVISSSHCVAKGVKIPPGAKHLSYVHAPMRYMWDRFEEYFGPGRSGLLSRAVAHLIRPYLQAWDRSSSRPSQVHRLIANSRFIRERIREVYGREASVVYPFADLDFFQDSSLAPRKPYYECEPYLVAGAFAPYKRVDLILEAFRRSGRKLRVVGSGQDLGRLQEYASSTIEFVGAVGRERLREIFRESRAFIFAGVEDFGITPVEALACGLPVIAYRRGGLLETVTEKTGLFFESQTSEALIETLDEFERRSQDPNKRFRLEDCETRAKEFSKARFQREIAQEIEIILSS
jgi:glycosyltransferase involved in cell wall biosynthesis